MKIKHAGIEIPMDNPFQNCVLNRKQYADILTSIVRSYASGFVLAVNNEWGTGKTTFINMWQQQLKNEGFRVLHFNAWENDFDANPIVPLMAELKTLSLRKDNQKTFKSLVKKGAVLVKNVAPAVAKAFADRYIDSGKVTDILKSTTDAIAGIFEEEIKNYAEKKKNLLEFREELEKYINAIEDDKPVIFIIDELDRCRPDYAVEILEQVKHFFNVPNMVFVLSIDKEQLGNAIRGYYGSDRINSDEYLRRFIDIEYKIPTPNIKSYCDYLYDYFDLQSFFNGEVRLKHRHLAFPKDKFTDESALFLDAVNASLRLQEKIFSKLRIILKSFEMNNIVPVNLLFIMIYIHEFHPEFYKEIYNKRFSARELLIKFYEILPRGISYERAREFIPIEAELAVRYVRYLNGAKWFEKMDLGKISKIDEIGIDFANYVNFFAENRDTGSFGLDHILYKINLMETFKS